ncbi:Sentrin-specific protease 7 [Galemys pyrenaicus]|uniref:Sentrin-specific protease 7 n=1 Tax=Galemys pyrenaicus TaxID=202257 RepID=A0A8J5ZXP0_GALPY|nr:Sentrin-specific protease 7 [Galemys pyrenaicus]
MRKWVHLSLDTGLYRRHQVDASSKKTNKQQQQQQQSSGESWKKSLRNKVLSLDHESKKGVRGRPVTSVNSSDRIPRVILTNVLGTELGRKYIKPSPVNEASLGDTDNLKSEQLSSSSDGSLESCQNLNPHKSFFLPERGSRPSKRVDNNNAQHDVHTKEKRRDDDGISFIICDTQTKDLNRGSRSCDHLEEGNRNKDDTCADSKIPSRKRKKRLRNNLPDGLNSTFTLYNSAGQSKEQENDSTVSSIFEKSSENCHQDPKLLEVITPEPIKNDLNKHSSFSQEVTLSAAQESSSNCSITETFDDSISGDALGHSALVEKDENEISTIGKPHLSEHSEGNKLLISAEPIVVSSDEEGPVEHKHSEILKLQPEQDQAIVNEDKNTLESTLSRLPLITCKSVQNSSELCPYNPGMENISCITATTEVDRQLDFIFTSVYIGKIKGASKGCVTFTPKYVKIPFQVSLNEISLLVDTTHLKRFGLWKSKDDDHGKRSHAILFLWVSSDYLQAIQTQLENTMLSQQSKANEFIFLELHSSISQREELKLKDIMTAISTTNGDLELSYPLTWLQALPLFQNISSKESSFIHYYCASTCSFPAVAAAAEEMKMKPVSQPSNIDTAKPTYTFLQKQSSGCYSLSITSNPDEEWREVRHTGPVQKLIVYPPPPTKGGLGVTNEDLECLEEGEFLNDVIIDFYLKYLILEKASDELVERSHIFSSFFYKCLTRKENNITEDNPNLSYLEVEWEVKRKTHREFSKTNMVDLCPKVPKQDNSSDCGVYLLQYVESFFTDPIVNFELPIQLEKWFPRHVIKTKREDIRELILKLHLQQQKASRS